MDNNTKAIIMQRHYNQIGQDAPFMLRATGEFEWFDGAKEPTAAKLKEWEIEYNEETVLVDQKQSLLNLIKTNEYHLISRRFASDISTWETKLDKWDAQLEEVKAGNLVEIEPLPVFE